MIRLTCLLTACAVLAATAMGQPQWPLFHGDMARTGFSSGTTTAGLVELWDTDLGSAVYTSPVAAGGRVYISTADARLVALEAATGNLLWQDTLPSWSESTPAVSGGRIYLGCNDHKIYCLDAATGGSLWQALTQSWVESSPLVFDGKVYIGGMDHHFYAWDAVTGAPVFSIQAGGDLLTAPSTDGQKVFFSGDDEKIHAVTPTGSALWTQEAPGAVYGAPVVAEGKIVYGSIANGGGLSYNRVKAINAATGASLWQYDGGQNDFFYATPAAGYGNVYLPGFQGTVRAFDLDDGSLTWSRTLGNFALLSSPALSNGVLYLGSNDGWIYALDAFTGAVLDQAQTGALVQSSPAVAEGRLFAGSADGHMRAFSLSSPVSISVSPGGVTVPPGGTLQFGVTFTELSGSAQNFQGWLRVTRPTGLQLNFGDPVTLSLGPGGSLTLQARVRVPDSAPAGNYIMASNTGSSQAVLWDAASFNFTITGTDGDPSAPDNWQAEMGPESSLSSAAGPLLPEVFDLGSPCPNPFNPAATLRVSLPQAGEVSLKVYDVTGRLAATLLDGPASAGVHEVVWNASGQASGVFFFRLQAAGQVKVQRGVLAK